MTITGPDLSHFQQGSNFAAIKAGGHSYVVLKATEGVGYVDPTFAANRRAAHAAGLLVGIYHFARAGSPAAEAAYFTGVVGKLQAGEFAVLDWEVPAPAGTTAPAWCKTWLDAVKGSLGAAPLIYMNQSAVTGSNWSLVAPLYGLWLAKYDNAPAAQTPVPYWGTPAMKQWTDKGTVPGVGGTCDVNVFYGSAAQLAAYGTNGGTTDMPLTDADVAKILDWTIAVPGGGTRTLSQLIAGNPALTAQVGDLHGKVIDSKFDLTSRPGPDADDLYGQVLSTRAEVRALHSAPAVDAQALADALVADTAAVSTLADALAAAIAKRLGNG